MSDDAPQQTRAGFIAKFKAAGFDDIEVHEAPDGQLLFELHGEAEDRLMEQFVAKLQEARASQPERPGQSSPFYLKDDSPEGRFWQRACLRARKFDVDRGMDLYLSYLDFRAEFGTDDPNDPDAEQTVELLKTNFARCCGNTDKSGRYIFSFDAGDFKPSLWTPRICARVIHHIVVNATARYPDLPARGIVTIGNMRGWGYSNFDPETEKIIMKLLTRSLPVRQGTMYIFDAPWVMRMVLPVIKMFMKKKLRERMKSASTATLLEQIAPSQLDEEYGGEYTRDMFCTSPELAHPALPGDGITLTNG
ncbi:hypothetical protein PTSG_04027 [Salpingoeca rosetta]|uniref:CRAL-TRIO domain-containing protein n=1 Tax=Salpingoeca rosetta (strain ATCC 50818 / BSB-021) TaxID=946362 RepID=F2U7K2_SALR5|nr:uncharacterized protein PTSG_04027 [Salpingoeca rosetta]EGD83419.1 hypothetical protein PTSG_04027 [Salpingoeca rosetta]|eukprot:XP_004994923.1 hypothetical protein PTSG_04027 [Salpingoeca rosetta]